jgi:hypothetical protein
MPPVASALGRRSGAQPGKDGLRDSGAGSTRLLTNNALGVTENKPGQKVSETPFSIIKLCIVVSHLIQVVERHK